MISLLTRRYTYRGDRENDGEKGREGGGRACVQLLDAKEGTMGRETERPRDREEEEEETGKLKESPRRPEYRSHT